MARLCNILVGDACSEEYGAVGREMLGDTTLISQVAHTE
jgi:hypothetical protein